MPTVSNRATQTSSAIIDVILTKYQHVQYNLARGSAYFGMSTAVREKLQHLLSTDQQSAYVSAYGDVPGDVPLRKRWANVIASNHSSTAQLEPDALFPNHEFMITAGANQAFVNIIFTICDPGDEVLLVLPYYFSHECALSLAGVTPVTVSVDSKTFLPSMLSVSQHITAKSKALVVVNPSNPSGIVYPKTLLQQLQNLCTQQNLWLIIDEAYRECDFSNGPPQLVWSPPLNDNTVKIYTMSKAYGLAGWRVGALLYPNRIASHVRKVQDTIVTHPSRCSQTAAYHALQHDPLVSINGKSSNISKIADVRQIFITALRPVYKQFAQRFHFVEPLGGFFFFLQYRPHELIENTSEDDDMRTVEYLAESHSISVAPGFAFGMPGYIRICFGAIQPEKAQATSQALAKAIATLFDTLP